MFIFIFDVLGGAFGLFTGFSILSLVELGYWIWVLMTRLTGYITS